MAFQDIDKFQVMNDESLLDMDLAQVPEKIGSSNFFLTDLTNSLNGLKELGSRFLLFHSFINRVAEISKENPDLTYRTPAEIRAALSDGKGDIYFVEGRPVAITLIPRLFPPEIQTMMLGKLGYPSSEVMNRESRLYFQKPIREIALGLTPDPQDREKGHYREVKLRLLREVAYKDSMSSKKTAYTSSTSSMAASAIVSARGAMSPVHPENTILGASIAAFAPDEYSPKSIPDYQEIRWMAGPKLEELLTKLAGVFISRERRDTVTGYRYFTKDEPIEPPVVFTSMVETYAFIEFLNSRIDGVIKAGEYTVRSQETQETNALKELHEHLRRVIINSPKFQESKEGLGRVADELHLPDEIDQETKMAYVLLLNTLSEINAERSSNRKI